MRILSIATMVAFAMPTVINAEEVGKINLTMNGEAREFFVISATRGDETVRTASFKDDGRLPSLDVQGHPVPRFTASDVFSISAFWFGSFDPGKSPDVEIIYLPETMTKPFYTSDQVPEAPQFTLDSFEQDGTSGRATGSFTAKLCFVPKLYEPPDMNDCKVIEGTFDTALDVR